MSLENSFWYPISVNLEYYKSSQRQREIYACLTMEQCGNFLGWLAYVYF